MGEMLMAASELNQFCDFGAGRTVVIPERDGSRRAILVLLHLAQRHAYLFVWYQQTHHFTPRPLRPMVECWKVVSCPASTSAFMSSTIQGIAAGLKPNKLRILP